MDIKQEDLIKFWTYFGFQFRRPLPEYSMGIPSEKDWYSPFDKHHTCQLPQITLASLYKYVIPKLQDKGYQSELIALTHGKFAVSLTDMYSGEQIIIESKQPTEALYKAIMAVIDKG